MDTSRCGQVMTPLQTPDWAPYFAQLQAAIAAQEQAGSDQLEAWQAEFDTWFERIKGQLSEDAAGNLQIQVDNVAAAAQAAQQDQHCGEQDDAYRGENQHDCEHGVVHQKPPRKPATIRACAARYVSMTEKRCSPAVVQKVVCVRSASDARNSSDPA